MKVTYDVAVIGLGRMGTSIDDEVHLPEWTTWKRPYAHALAYQGNPRTRLVAGADPAAEKRRRFAERYGVPAERVFADYREMLANVPLDIVSVTTHAPQHCEAAIAAAEAGVKAIFCEKPLASSLEECDRMVEAAERYGTITAVGTLRRWGAFWNRIRALIESGEAGRPLQVIQLSGGSLLHTESHFFDVGRYMLGNPAPEWAVGYLLDPQTAADGTVADCPGHGYVHFQGGAEYWLVAGGVISLATEVHCEKASFLAYNDGDEARMWVKDPGLAGGRYTRELPLDIPRDLPSPTAAAVAELVSCLDRGGHTRCTFRDGRTAVELGMAFHESHRRGNARVDWPLTERSLRVGAR